MPDTLQHGANAVHALGARFHPQRRLGGVLPHIDLGTAGIAFLLGVGLFTQLPTLIEIIMVLATMFSRDRLDSPLCSPPHFCYIPAAGRRGIRAYQFSPRA